MDKQKSSNMTIYFPFDSEGVIALRKRLNEIASRYGYKATRGGTTGQGNLSELLLAIDAGEIATVFMSDEAKALIPWLDEQQSAVLLTGHTMADQNIYDAIGALREQLAEAADREAQADAEEVVEYFSPPSKRQVGMKMIENGLRLLKEAEEEN
jgi:hypothetical protein